MTFNPSDSAGETHPARLSGGRFLVLGRAGMDLYPDPPGTRTEDATAFYTCLGGSSANIAVSLVRLGCSAGLVSCVSDDAVGRFVRNRLADHGVGCAAVRTVAGQVRTSLALAESRTEDHQSVIYRNGAADFLLESGDVTGLDYAACDGFVVTGTALAADPSRQATLRALALARAAGCVTVIDIDYRPYSWTSAADAAAVLTAAAELCDIVVGNDLEFDVLAGQSGAGKVAARDISRSGRLAIYKMGELGAITYTNETEIRTGIYPVTALKPTGAGDSFLGGFLAGLVTGYSLRAAVLRGSAAAAIVVGRVGCAPAMPTAAEIDAFMARHPGPLSAVLDPDGDAHAHRPLR